MNLASNYEHLEFEMTMIVQELAVVMEFDAEKANFYLNLSMIFFTKCGGEARASDAFGFELRAKGDDGRSSSN